LWRIIIMGRAVSLLVPATPWAGYALVMLIADAAARAARALTERGEAPRSTPRLLLGMAAIGPSNAAQADRSGLTCLITGLGIVTFPLWLLGTLKARVTTTGWLS